MIRFFLILWTRHALIPVLITFLAVIHNPDLKIRTLILTLIHSPLILLIRIPILELSVLILLLARILII